MRRAKGAKNYCDMGDSSIRHVTFWKISDKDMRHCHNLKIDIRHWGPPIKGPYIDLARGRSATGAKTRVSGGAGEKQE